MLAIRIGALKMAKYESVENKIVIDDEVAGSNLETIKNNSTDISLGTFTKEDSAALQKAVDDATNFVVSELKNLKTPRDVTEMKQRILAYGSEPFKRATSMDDISNVASSLKTFKDKEGNSDGLAELAMSIEKTQRGIKKYSRPVQQLILGKKNALARQRNLVSDNVKIVNKKVKDIKVDVETRKLSIEKQMNRMYDNMAEVEMSIYSMSTMRKSFHEELDEYRKVNPELAKEVDDSIGAAIDNRIVDMMASKIVLKTNYEILQSEYQHTDQIKENMVRVESLILPTMAMNSYAESVAQGNSNDAEFIKRINKAAENQMERTIQKSIETTKSMSAMQNGSIMDVDKLVSAFEKALDATVEARAIQNNHRNDSIESAKKMIEAEKKSNSIFRSNDMSVALNEKVQEGIEQGIKGE